MPSTRIVADFLCGFANNNGFKVFDALYGTIELGAPSPIIQSSGAVYGIWVQSAEPMSGLAPIPDHTAWFPVYWGKDIAPVSRMKAHVQGHQNGNINLPAVSAVQGKPLIFGAILVSRYREFEDLLHQRFQPLLGTRSAGKRSTVVVIEE